MSLNKESHSFFCYTCTHNFHFVSQIVTKQCIFYLQMNYQETFMSVIDARWGQLGVVGCAGVGWAMAALWGV